MTSKFLLFLALFAGISSPLQASTPKDPYVYFFAQSLGDLTEELEIAREEGKQGLFLFFEQDECPFCHRMKQTVLNQPEVQEYYRKHFRSLAMDVEGSIEIVDFHGKEMTQKEFASENRARATPLLAFFNLDGELVFKYVGATSGVDEFMWMGEYIADGIYLKTDDRGYKIRFTRYKRMRQKNKTF
ncbi:MAG: thioredoxin family protein [Gammaproteobacteria bacterium]|jgi:thioredoxin-related protein